MTLKSQIKRVSDMEECLDISKAAFKKISEAFTQYEEAQKDFKKLSDYYGSTSWMADYEADEAGYLPKDLKRGVLSEDAVYNLLTENRELNIRMLKCITKAFEWQLF